MSAPNRLALLSLAIGPKTPADAQRLAQALEQLTAEDPTFSFKADQQTGEVVIAGLGEMHLEIIVDRLKREFNVEANVGRPRVACKETLTRPAEGENSDDEDRDSWVHAPRRPVPTLRASGIALPEPDDDRAGL